MSDTNINKRISGILITALVFAVMVVACGSESSNDDINFLDEHEFSTENPGDAVLSVAGLTENQFNQIKNAAGDRFKGWELDIENELFTMAWTEKSLPDFNRVADVLETIFDEGDSGNKNGFYYLDGDKYSLEFFSRKISEGGYYAPSRALVFYKYL